MAVERHLHVVGLGLIGGSVAAGLSGLQGDREYHVTGWDRKQKRRRTACEQGLVKDVFPPDRLPDTVVGVVLAVPVPQMLNVAREVVSGSHHPGFMTDTGSTKSWVCERMETFLPASVTFVGAHPMAGSEQSGPEAADPLLFENAICVVTPSGKSDGARGRVVNLWQDLGGHVVKMDPVRHDRAVAYISHLPHLVAGSLLQTVREEESVVDQAFGLAAGGFRDMTRVAMGDPGLWRDIFQTNASEVRRALETFQWVIKGVKERLEQEDWDGLTRWLRDAGTARQALPEKTKGLLGRLYDLRIMAPDEPGILAEVTGVLAEDAVNITDIEVLRVREGDVGTIKLGFRRPEERDRAREILEEQADRVRLM